MPQRHGRCCRVAGSLRPRAKFDGGYSILGTIAESMTAVKETHHIYPALVLSRFRNPAYDVSGFTLMALHTVSLIESALDIESHG